MDRTEFRQLFEKALEEAAQKAEQKHNVQVPRNYKLYLLDRGLKFGIMSIGQILSLLYINENEFYVVVDISVDGINLEENFSLVSIRPSGHTPVEFSKTWNYSIGLGPFKTLVISELKSLT